MNILGFETGFSLPTLTSGAVGTGMLYVLIFIIFVITASLIAWLIIDRMAYKKKVVVFEKISGKDWAVSFKDRARVVKVGDGGEEILFLKKKKVYRSAYGKKMGVNEYWYAIGQDGYWYNIVIGDLDAKMGMLDIEPIDRDVRLMHVAIRRNIHQRHDKQSFMDKYGQQIFSALMLIIFFAGMWFMVDALGSVVEEVARHVSTLAEQNELCQSALAKVDSVCSGGTGLGGLT